MRFGCFAERIGGGAGNRLGEAEIIMVLHLAEIDGTEKLLQTNDVRPSARRLADPGKGLRQVLSRVAGATRLD